MVMSTAAAFVGFTKNGGLFTAFGAEKKRKDS
jgi:hypothetical protein